MFTDDENKWIQNYVNGIKGDAGIDPKIHFVKIIVPAHAHSYWNEDTDAKKRRLRCFREIERRLDVTPPFEWELELEKHKP